jgi:hypothetical protein
MNRIPYGLTTSLAVLSLLSPLAGCDGGGGGGGGGGAGGVMHADTDCGWLGQDAPAIAPDIQARLEAYAEIRIEPDLSHLSPTERETLDKLIAAAKIMHELFWQQACPCHEELALRVQKLTGPGAAAAGEYFRINMGPWDRRLDREPFLGAWVHPDGANYYPLDLSQAEKDRIAAGEDRLGDLFTMVRRNPEAALVAVPYSIYFQEPLQQVAKLLREAAAITRNESLKRFCAARAAALLNDDYYESDMLWMDLDSPVEITIGPYETYEDGLFGFKAAFEAFVTVVDPVESERLAKYKQELPWLESRLPIPDKYKNPNRGSESPIRVVDEVFAAGDTRAGIQTIAFNLPNDERVREAKGSKKVMLRNMMDAKFEKILTPIARLLVVEDQLQELAAASFFQHTLFHEMSHGLGPGRVTIAGRETEVRLELKDTYATIEEAKADAMGEWAIFQLQSKGLFPESVFAQQAVTYLAGLFRSIRFGIAEAHGQANAIQFNWLLEKQAISFEAASGRFRVDVARFPQAIEKLVAGICILQAEGDYAAAKEMIANYGVMPPVLETALSRLTDIPVDIKPVYPVAGES